MNFPTNKSEIAPWLFSGWRLIALLGLVLLTGIFIWWAFSGHTDKELPIIANIGVDNGKNAVVANLISNQEKVVNNAENIANQANANLVNSQRRDSNQFSNSQSDADDAYCSHYPCDSTCAGWRQRTGKSCPSNH